MEENVYNFNHMHRGLAVVIVNEKFNVPDLSYRRGAKNDLKNMKKLFTKLAFAVKMYKNLSVEQMIYKLKKAASNKKFLEDSDCFVCVISTHGEEIKHITLGSKQTTVQHALYGIDGRPIYTSDVTTLFNMSNCPALAGKPKLFFIQACRLVKGQVKRDLGHEFWVESESESTAGQSEVSDGIIAIHFDSVPFTQESTEACMDEDEGVSDDEWQESQLPDDSIKDEEKEEREEEEMVCQETEEDAIGKGDTRITLLPQASSIACHMDELIMWPVVSGLGAFRNPKTGSYMLTFLHDELLNMPPDELLLHALTRVSYKMAQRTSTNGNKVVSCISHRLRKEIHFPIKQKLNILKKIFS